MTTKEQYREYNALFVHCWDLFKVYAVKAKEDSEAFWEQYMADEYKVYEKHGFTPLAKGLLIESRKEIMRILKEGGTSEHGIH